MEQGDKPIRKTESVPYVVYSDTVANYHWVIRKLVIALIVTVVLMFASNAIWIFEWCSFDYKSTETTVESDGDGVANYTGGDGGVMYVGESDSTDNIPDTAQ